MAPPTCPKRSERPDQAIRARPEARSTRQAQGCWSQAAGRWCRNDRSGRSWGSGGGSCAPLDVPCQRGLGDNLTTEDGLDHESRLHRLPCGLGTPRLAFAALVLGIIVAARETCCRCRQNSPVLSHAPVVSLPFDGTENGPDRSLSNGRSPTATKTRRMRNSECVRRADVVCRGGGSRTWHGRVSFASSTIAQPARLRVPGGQTVGPSGRIRHDDPVRPAADEAGAALFVP